MLQDARNDSNILLSVRELEVSYGGTPVLDKVSFDLKKGERVAIVGQSGSGKSTVVGAILGLLSGAGRVTHGSILLDGEDLADATQKELRGIRGK